MKNSNSEFLIASKSKIILKKVYNITMNMQKKDLICKEKINYLCFDLLNNIYLANYNKIDINKYLPLIQTDISLLDFYLEILYEKKYISKNQLNELLYILINITKMTTVWAKNLEVQNA